MLGIFGLHVALVVVERDRTFGDVEGEVAIDPVAVFPAVMGHREEVEDEPLDGVVNGHRRVFGLGLVPDGRRDVDLAGWQGNQVLASFGFEFSVWPLSP
jgi:hypothetical protein